METRSEIPAKSGDQHRALTVIRHSRRLTLALLLTVLGFALYQLLEPVERWRLPLEDPAEEFFATFPDGRFTISGTDSRAHGAIRKRDAATGALVAESSGTDGGYECQSRLLIRPPWQRVWAGLPNKNPAVLHLFDLETGETRQAPIEPVPVGPLRRHRKIDVSPRGDLAAISHYDVKYHLAGWESWDETVKVEIHLIALPGGERLDRFVLERLPTGKPADNVLSYAAPEFSPNGSYVIVPSKTGDTRCLRLWDTAKRKPAGALTAGTWWSWSSPDGRFLQTEEAGNRTKIWDLADLERPVAVAVLPAKSHGSFSPDSRTLAHVDVNDVVFVDPATGKERGRTELPAPGYGLAFSPDSALLAIGIREPPDTPMVSVLDVATQTILWTSPINKSADLLSSKAFFAADSETLILTKHNGTSYDVELRHTRTGRLLASFDRPSGYYWNPVLSGNGRRALLIDSPSDDKNAGGSLGWFRKLIEWLPFQRERENVQLVRVIDLPTRREVFRLEESQGEDRLLSADGNTVVSHHLKSAEGPHVRCYDVPARRPWLKIAGIPIGLGLVFILWGAWLQRRRDARAARVAP